MNWLWNVFFLLIGILVGWILFTDRCTECKEKQIKRITEINSKIGRVLREVAKENRGYFEHSCVSRHDNFLNAERRNYETRSEHKRL